MRFSVDAHAIGQHLTGNETYIRNLLQGFAALDHDADFVTYLSRQPSREDLPDRFHKHRVSVNPFVRLGFDIPRRLREDRPDLLHVQYTAPVFCSTPIVVSVHDVSFLEHPEYFTPFRALQLRCTVRRTVKAAARVLTVTEFSKRSILAAYALPEEKVTVLANGVSGDFRPIAREVAQRALRASRGIEAPFILTVGDLQPRKNHLGLIRAFEQLITAHPQLPHHLVVVGKATWHSPAILAAARKSSVGSRIHFTGFVSDEELRQLYGACELFVYPSFYEGFGLPILEAMASGRAVACSSTSGMPEVADSAALLFDPHSVADMVLAMRDLLLNPELRMRMERLGTQRATMFSWDRTAARTLDVYYEVAGNSNRAPAPVKKRASAALP
ncbi:MAG TPA: glycosyltransferase family 1 protein [Bryobacteraceae bacterium]|nr:glycosyltransferase family 1 protein [Bryobacteraceae bacterium]